MSLLLSGPMMKLPAAAGGSISLVGYATGSHPGDNGGTWTIDLTSLTGGSDTSPSENDVVFVFEGVFGIAGSGIATSGYTTDVNSFYDPGENTNLRAAYKVMGSTPDTSVAINDSGNFNCAQAAIAVVLRGVDTSTPLDVTTTTANSGTFGDAAANPPSITPTTSGAWILCVGVGSTDGSSAVPYDFTSSDFDTFISKVSDTDAISGTVGVGIKAWTSGAFDPSAFGQATAFGTVDGNWQAASLAIRPA